MGEACLLTRRLDLCSERRLLQRGGSECLAQLLDLTPPTFELRDASLQHHDPVRLRVLLLTLRATARVGSAAAVGGLVWDPSEGVAQIDPPTHAPMARVRLARLQAV